jgi:hypothetical protein
MALYDEDYSISAARTGDAVLRNLVLTGWGAAPTMMEQGRLYWRVTANGASSTLKLYRSGVNAAGNWASGDEMATGTFTIDADNFVSVTLSQANTSGLSGTCRVRAGENSRGDVVITYADEQDIKRLLHDSASLLSSSQFEGETRFEGVARQAKRLIDMWLRSAHGTSFQRKVTGEIQLADLAMPRQLAIPHSQLCVKILFENRMGHAPEFMEQAKYWGRLALDTFEATAPSLDFFKDDILDGRLRSSTVPLTRG